MTEHTASRMDPPAGALACPTTGLPPDAAAAFVSAFKLTTKAQPFLQLDYALRPGVKLALAYRPPTRRGKAQPVGPAFEDSCYVWQIWTVAAAKVHAEFCYIEKELQGWCGISEADALALLQGETLAESERHDVEAARIFGRLGR